MVFTTFHDHHNYTNLTPPTSIATTNLTFLSTASINLSLLQVKHVCQVSEVEQRLGKCIVIGLQSTGEARTLEQVEREEELSDFVSTSKGVLQSLVEKHFPAPDRGKITKILGIGKQSTILGRLCLVWSGGSG